MEKNEKRWDSPAARRKIAAQQLRMAQEVASYKRKPKAEVK